jgi:AraC family transcriptional regulator
MTPRIEILPEKKIIGQRIRMSIANDKTPELWRGFMPRRKEIINPLTADLLCLQDFATDLNFKDYNQNTEFDKWAAIEVANFDTVPAGMETYNLPGGLYAVFLHKGAADTGAATFQYIYGTWLPSSNYVFDNRAQFEVLGEKYKNNDPRSEEEIWIPIKSR